MTGGYESCSARKSWTICSAYPCIKEWLITACNYHHAGGIKRGGKPEQFFIAYSAATFTSSMLTRQSYDRTPIAPS